MPCPFAHGPHLVDTLKYFQAGFEQARDPQRSWRGPWWPCSGRGCSRSGRCGTRSGGSAPFQVQCLANRGPKDRVVRDPLEELVNGTSLIGTPEAQAKARAVKDPLEAKATEQGGPQRTWSRRGGPLAGQRRTRDPWRERSKASL